MIALPKAEIVALFVECILYGVFCVTFLTCIYILVYRRTTEKIHYPMLVTAIIMWLLATIHVTIDLIRILDAFIEHGHDSLGTDGFFANVHHVTHVTKSAIYITHTCVSDCLIAYRTFIVVRNKSILVFLTAMILGTAVAGYGSIYVLNHMAPLTSDIFATSLAPWITAFNVITAATNIIATALIAGRIWYVNRRVTGAITRKNLHPIIGIVVESGAVYACALITLTVLYTTDDNAQFIVLDAVTPLIGIVFSLIIIRVGLKVSHNGSSTAGNQTSTWISIGGTKNTTTNRSRGMSFGNSKATTSVGQEGRFAMQPVAVKVSTMYDSDVREYQDFEVERGIRKDSSYV